MPKKVVMVVDDDIITLDTVAAILSKKKYYVIKSTSGREALKKLKKEMPDLMLIDVMMPGMNGIELIEKIRANPEIMKIKVALLTVLDFLSVLGNVKDRRKKLKELAIIDYIPKPFSNKILLEKVDKLIGH